MRRVAVASILVAASVGVFSCKSLSLEAAAERYRLNGDYRGLEIVYSHLWEGMPREQVVELLGEPDYSPTARQFYYGSSRDGYLEDRTVYTGKVPYTLVVQYKEVSSGGTIVEVLDWFFLQPVGE